MKRKSNLGLFLVVLILVCGALSDGSCGATAHADEPAAVTLARFLCGESDGRKEELAPLLYTMATRAQQQHMTLMGMVRAYSAPLRGAGGARGVWVRALPVLPTHQYRTNWWTALDAARSFLAGTLTNPCQGVTNHFGSVQDVARRYPNAAHVDCGNVRNVYLEE